MKFDDIEIFDKLTLAQLFKECHSETSKKRKQISDVIATLTQFINNTGNAAIIAPIIKDYLDVSVKNDDQMMKLATVIQRLVQAEKKVADDGTGLLSAEEKRDLLKNYRSELEDLRTGISDAPVVPNQAKEIVLRNK